MYLLCACCSACVSIAACSMHMWYALATCWYKRVSEFSITKGDHMTNFERRHIAVIIKPNM